MRDKRANARSVFTPRAFTRNQPERKAGPLEVKLNAQLQNPRIAESGYGADSATVRKARRGQAAQLVGDRPAGAKSSEVRMVQNIEGLSAKLKSNRMRLTAKAEVLGHREIDTFCRWAVNGAALRVARNVSYAGPAVGGLSNEARAIKPLIYGVGRIGIRIAKKSWSSTGSDRRSITDARRIIR